MPGKLSLRINTAEVVALTFRDGFKVNSDYGDDQIMYSLEDGRKLYADRPLVEAIEAADIKPRQPFEIVKRSAKNYEVRPVNPGGRGSATFPAATPVTPVPTSSIPGKEPERSQHSAGRGGGVGGDSAVRTGDPMKNRMLASLCIAIDCASEAEAYAARHKMLVQFSAEDIRTMANTVFMQAHKGGF